MQTRNPLRYRLASTLARLEIWIRGFDRAKISYDSGIADAKGVITGFRRKTPPRSLKAFQDWWTAEERWALSEHERGIAKGLRHARAVIMGPRQWPAPENMLGAFQRWYIDRTNTPGGRFDGG